MSGAPPRVLAVGDAIVDIVTPPLVGLGPGDSQHELPQVRRLPGGNATNFALEMAALGVRSSLVAALGTDPFAQILVRAYRDLGVRPFLRRDPTRPTGTTVALTWSGGGRTLLTAAGANASLRAEDVTTRALERADHVHRAGYWWTPTLQGRPTRQLLAHATRLGASTSMDIATDPRGWSARRIEGIRSCLRFVGTFFGNREEVCAVGGDDNPLEAASALCRNGAQEVVIHRGPRGATRVREGRASSVSAYPVAVDNPTGCGDVFNAGYVFSALRGHDPRSSLAFANACAALHLQDAGRPYPGAAFVARFMRQHATRARPDIA